MDPLLIAHLLNGLLIVVLPIALGIYLTRRFRLSWWLWWIGAGTFVLSQVGHIPFNAALTLLFNRGILPAPPEDLQLLVNSVLLGLSAGLWEEFLRYATYKWWATDARSWRKGLLLGAGHGGIEAIILGGLVLFTFATMVNMRGADLSQIIPSDQLALAQQQISTYWGLPWSMALLGALERALTIPVHLALSLLVLQAFTRKRFAWVWLAVLWHAALNAAALMVQGNFGSLAAEGVIAMFTVVSLAIIRALYQPEAPEDDLGGPSYTPLKLAPIEPSSESLENSRFSS